MRKLPHNLEDFIDYFIVSVIDIISPLLKKLNFTPNILTTIGVLFAGASAYYFIQNNYKLAGILLFISYFFDCADGHFARKYNMVTEFGDYYDHIADIIKYTVIFGLLFYTLYMNNSIELIIIIIIMMVLTNMHLGCQEKYVDFTNKGICSPSLSIVKKLCNAELKTEVENMLSYSSYCGNGTFILILCLIIYNLPRIIIK